jgi:hypothetical protein
MVSGDFESAMLILKSSEAKRTRIHFSPEPSFLKSSEQVIHLILCIQWFPQYSLDKVPVDDTLVISPT